MASLNVRVTLKNVNQNIDANQLADIVEDIVKKYTNMDTTSTVYDSDGVDSSNPIFTSNLMRKVKG